MDLVADLKLRPAQQLAVFLTGHQTRQLHRLARKRGLQPLE
jgi:hypothetical protein